MIATPTASSLPHALDPKPTRRRAAKTPKPQAAKPQAAARSKVSLYLSDRTAKLLAVHATMEETSMSEVVEALIAANCKRWVVSDRARNAEEASGSQDVESAA